MESSSPCTIKCQFFKPPNFPILNPRGKGLPEPDPRDPTPGETAYRLDSLMEPDVLKLDRAGIG
jgi:hypothetical protein